MADGSESSLRCSGANREAWRRPPAGPEAFVLECGQAPGCSPREVGDPRGAMPLGRGSRQYSHSAEGSPMVHCHPNARLTPRGRGGLPRGRGRHDWSPPAWPSNSAGIPALCFVPTASAVFGSEGPSVCAGLGRGSRCRPAATLARDDDPVRALVWLCLIRVDARHIDRGAARETASGSTGVRNVTLPPALSSANTQVTTQSTNAPPAGALRKTNSVGTSSAITVSVTGPSEACTNVLRRAGAAVRQIWRERWRRTRTRTSRGPRTDPGASWCLG